MWCGLNICLPCQIHMLKSKPSVWCDDVWMWCPQPSLPTAFFASFALWGHGKQPSTNENVSPTDWICYIIILDFPAPRTVQDKYQFFKPSSLWYFFHSSSELLRHHQKGRLWGDGGPEGETHGIDLNPSCRLQHITSTLRLTASQRCSEMLALSLVPSVTDKSILH